MIRYVLAAMAALALSACNPSVKFDAADPFKTLRPWQHNWAEVKKLPGGVEYIILKKGDGKGGFPSPADTVEANYDGRLASNGNKFDASDDHGGPQSFQLNGVIPGWTEGLQKMQPGDSFMFWIPAAKAYGSQEKQNQMTGEVIIPANSDLMFRIDLVAIHPAAVSDEKAWAKVTPWPIGSADVQRRPSGLEYLAVSSGPAGGPMPVDGDQVVIHFQGRLADVAKEEGETDQDVKNRSVVLDTFESQRPWTEPLSSFAAGWVEALKLMHKGDHWMVRMPPNVLYGDEGDGRIPPGATVIYEISLEDVLPAPTPVAPPADAPKPAPVKPPAKPAPH